MWKIFIFIFVIVNSAKVPGQTPEIPYTYRFDSYADCAQYDSLILEYIVWLNQNPADLMTSHRSRVHAFIREWAEESPTILLFPYCEVSSPVFRELKKNSLNKDQKREMLMSYYNGMIAYLIRHPGETDLGVVQMAGIRNLIHFARLNPPLEQTRCYNRFIQLLEKERLQEWVNGKIKPREQELFLDFQEGRVPRDKQILEEYLPQ